MDFALAPVDSYHAIVEHRYLFHILVEPLLHVLGYILRVKVALIAVAQHLLGAVVAAHDDKAPVLRGVEHIIGCLLLRRASLAARCPQRL